MKLLYNSKVVKGLQELINRCVWKENVTKGWRIVRNICKNKERTGHEMRLATQIGEYEMDQVIFDLGSNANFLPKKRWERMGRPTQEWSPIKLRVENQQKIIPMGHLYGVMVD